MNEENKEIIENEKPDTPETEVNPFVEETKIEPIVFEEEPQKPKKKFPVFLIIILCTLGLLIGGYYALDNTGNTYNLQEVFDTTAEASVKLPKNYYLGEDGYIYTFDEDNMIVVSGALGVYDCTEEEYESYKEMYIEYYAFAEESLNNLEVLHLTNEDDETTYDSYIFYRNECIWMISVQDLDYSSQLKIIDGIQ